MKLNISFPCTKACLIYRITQKNSNIVWIIYGNRWICILNCVSWFVSIIINFNALCDAYIVQIESYAVILKNNRIFCLLLGITFDVFIEGDDHVWLYFVYF